jgi:hypothetical protein
LSFFFLDRFCKKPSARAFHVKIAKTPGEVEELLEVGFEYVCNMDDAKFFRKRK